MNKNYFFQARASLKDESKMTDMKNELYILKKLVCPFIVKLYCHFVVNNEIYLFIKLANGGNLAKYVKEKGVLTEVESRAFWAQMLVGVEYMHSLSIAHRDIKLENVLLVRHPNSRMTILLTDFGLSRVITTDGESVALSRTMCGTPEYMSPEIIANEPFDAFQADVWAMGVALYVMLCSKPPFRSDESKIQLNNQRNCKWKWDDNTMAASPTPQLNGIMKSMLEPDPHTRVRIAALVHHPWIVTEYRNAARYCKPPPPPPSQQQQQGQGQQQQSVQKTMNSSEIGLPNQMD